MKIRNDLPSVSAPTSPSRCSPENMHFYSVPTSPTKGVPSAPSGNETEPTTPIIYEDANSTLDDFEFETSRRFNLKDIDIATSDKFEEPLDYQQQQQSQERKRGDSLPTPMAFADELFCDGKVLPLMPPLKLPPRLHNPSNKSSTASSPRSPSSVPKLPFSPWRRWNDDFDPFMVALETVSEERRGKTRGNKYRRARSLSPFRTTRPQWSDHSLGFDNQQDNHHWRPRKPLQQSGPNSNEPREPKGLTPSTWTDHQDKVKQVGRSLVKLPEPKGLSFARRVRLVKIGNEMPGEPNTTSLSGESKRHKIKKFLLRSGSMGKVHNEDKLGEQNAAPWKSTFSRKFSFKSVGSAECSGVGRVAEVTKMTVAHYGPRLLLCLGLGADSVK